MLNIKLDKNSPNPKYIQLEEAILDKINKGELKESEALPSINEISKTLNISRETIFKAFKILKERGVLKSVDKIGYFIKSTQTKIDYNIFLILDKFTTFKEKIYLGIINTFGTDARITIFYHHHNIDLLERTIKEDINSYSHFIITTFFKGSEQKQLNSILKEISNHKRFIIDNFEALQIATNAGMVFQDFKNAIIDNFLKHIDSIKTYSKMVLIKDPNSYHGDKIEEGLRVICENCNMIFQIIHKTDEIEMVKGNLFITIDGYEQDLIKIVKSARNLKWKLGNEIGLISYNDTPAKEVICGGITVITTDFYKMGEMIANMIVENQTSALECPTIMIRRKSF